MEYFRLFHDNVHLLQNGTDFDHFNKAGEALIPSVMKAISGPIVGFYGALASWIDWQLVLDVAVMNPNVSFVFIGPVIT